MEDLAFAAALHSYVEGEVAKNHLTSPRIYLTTPPPVPVWRVIRNRGASQGFLRFTHLSFCLIQGLEETAKEVMPLMK